MSHLCSKQKFFAFFLTAAILAIAFTNASRAAVSGLAEANATAAPANDNFANAQLLTGNSGGVTANNSAATKEAGEPSHALNKGGSSVWYKYIAPGNGVLRVETGGASYIDTLLSVYVGSSVGTLQLVTANDDYYDASGGGISSKVFIGTQTGGVYYIAVDGKDNATGAFSVFYEFTNSTPNDTFAGSFSLLASNGRRDISGTNVGASKDAGEPNHAGNAGGRSVWFRLPGNFSTAHTVTFSVTGRRSDIPSLGMHALMAIYTGSNLANLTPVASRQFTSFATITLSIAPQTNYYVALDGFDSGQGAETGTFTLNYGMLKNDKLPDFDRDGITDLTVFRPSTGTWYSLDSVTGNLRALQFGANGDRPLIGDFDQDGKTDYGVFRPDTGVWYLNESSAGFQAFSWGVAGDIPLVRTVNVGSTRIQAPVVFRPTNGTWYTYGLGFQPVTFGQLGDIPFSEDLTGDGTDEFAVFRPSNGTWYILDAVANQFRAVQFGANGDKPAAADYDGDGVADLAVFRPSTGTWYVINSHNNSFQAIKWGQSGDIPQVVQLNSVAEAELGVYRNGTWYFRRSWDGATLAFSFGNSTDIPMSSPVK